MAQTGTGCAEEREGGNIRLALGRDYACSYIAQHCAFGTRELSFTSNVLYHLMLSYLLLIDLMGDIELNIQNDYLKTCHVIGIHHATHHVFGGYGDGQR
jgi:hypothetical protein